MRQDFASHRSLGSKQYPRSCGAMHEDAARVASGQQAPNAADALRPSYNMVYAPPQDALAGTCVQTGVVKASHPPRPRPPAVLPAFVADRHTGHTIIAERSLASSTPSPHRPRQCTAPAPSPRCQRADPHRAADAQTRTAATGRRSAGAGRGARGAAGLGGRGREVDVDQVLLLGRRQRLHARQRGRDLPEQRLRASGRASGPCARGGGLGGGGGRGSGEIHEAAAWVGSMTP